MSEKKKQKKATTSKKAPLSRKLSPSGGMGVKKLRQEVGNI